MKSIDIKVQVIEDKFKIFRANTERNLASMLPEILRHVKGENTVSIPGDFQVLIARQVTFPSGESLTDLHVNPGEYLILFRPSASQVGLSLLLPKQFNKPPIAINKTEAFIGRSEEFQPDVDVEPFLSDPTAVSRKVAWLREDDGKWSIELDPDCHSGLFLNETRLVAGKRMELLDRAVLSFGSSLDKADLRLAITLSSK